MGLEEALVMVDEVKVDGEVKIDKQTGMKAYHLV